MSINECTIITFPKIADRRGNLSFIEGNRHVPFPIKRVFYVYDIPSAQDRGAHAHRSLQELVVCLSGSLEVRLDDGQNKKVLRLNRPWQGLFIPPMIWTSYGDFDPGTVYIVLASEYYEEEDYYRDYNIFLKDALNAK